MKVNLATFPKLIYLEEVLDKNEYADFMMFLQKQYPKVFEAWRHNAKQDLKKWHREFGRVLRKLNKRDQKKWDKHLAEEGGSCYCLSSDVSCLPEVIKTRKAVLGDAEDTP